MKRCINSHCVGSHVMGRAKNRLPWRAGKGEWLTMWSKMLSIHSYQKHQRQSSDHPKITIRRKHKTPLNKKTNIIILRKLLYCVWLAGLAWFELVRHVAETTWHIIRFHVMSQKDVRYWTSMPWSIDTCQVIYPLTDSITQPYHGLRFRAHWNHVLFWSWPWTRNYRFFRLDSRLKKPRQVTLLSWELLFLAKSIYYDNYGSCAQFVSYRISQR